MSHFFASARLATLLAVAVALLITSVAAGAAGAALILGQANTSGTAATSVTSSNGSRTLLVQNSSTSGFAIDARSSGGIGGQFLSSTSTGMAGFTSANDKFAVVGTHNGAAYGDGAAVRGDGRRNSGVSGSTSVDEADAVRGINVASVADYAGGHYANGVYGETRAQHGNGAFGFASATDGFGYGVWGLTSSPNGVGVTGQNTGAGLAGLFFGDVEIQGNLQVSSCTGCGATAVVAQTTAALAQGDPVAIAGVTTDTSGATMLIVRAAKAGDRIIGVADSTVTRVEGPRGASRLIAGEPGAAGGALLSVVTRGMLEMRATPQFRGMAAGTALSLNARGDLASSTGDSSPVVFVAGTLKDGRIVLFVNP